MPLVNPYCTLAQAQAEAQNSTSSDATSIETGINEASRWIDDFCRHDFLFHDHSVTPYLVPDDCFAQNLCVLPWPVLTLTKIEEIPLDGDATEIEASAYRVRKGLGSIFGTIIRNGRWIAQDAFTEGLSPQPAFNVPSQYRLTGTFGYAEAQSNPSSTPSPNLPAGLSHACAVIAVIFAGKYKIDKVGLDGQRLSLSVKDVPRSVLAVLDRYKIHVL